MAKWPTVLSCGDEQILLYNPVKIVKFIRKMEIYLNRDLPDKDQSIFDSAGIFGEARKMQKIWPGKNGSPSWIRTNGHSINSRMLYH